MNWPTDLPSHVSERLQLHGRAFDAKMGALLLPLDSDSPQIWLEGMSSWPDNYSRGELVSVSGILERKTSVNPPTSKIVKDENGKEVVEYSAGPGEGVETRWILVDFTYEKLNDIEGGT